MYYQNYEDYMRSVLGYPVSNDMYTYENSNYYYDEDNRNCDLNEEDIENMYPDIYKKINPIVCRECDSFNGKFTKEAVENIVEKIYSNIEMDSNINVININIENNRENDNRYNDNKAVENRNSDFRNIDNRSIHSNIRDRIQNVNKTSNVEQNRSALPVNRQRRPNNPLLRDLITILVLNRLLRRPRPNRPPFRPTFPPPPRPGDNYPIMPRPSMPRDSIYDDYIR